MLTALSLSSLLIMAPLPELPLVCAHDPEGVSDVEMRELYESGRSFPDFLDAATRRRALWDSNWARSESIDMELVARARAVGGGWRILAVAVDSCSDSVNTVPYLARLAALVDGLDIRVVLPGPGADLMAAYPTPDGRSATPTFVLLNSDWEEVGCLVERPDFLRDYTLENPDDMDTGDLYNWKMGWYVGNAGHDTVEQMVEMMEAAAAGGRICAAN